MQNRGPTARSAVPAGAASAYPAHWHKVLSAVLIAISAWLLIAGFARHRIRSTQQYAGSDTTCARWQAMRPSEQQATVRAITARVSATDTSLARVGELRAAIEDACHGRPHITLRRVVDDYTATDHGPR